MTGLSKRIGGAVLALALGLTAAAARDVTKDDEVTLATAVENFDTAFRGGDFETVINTIPDKVMNALAERLDAPADKLREALATQTAEIMKTVEFVDFEMKIEGAELIQTEDGLIYAILPTRTVMKSEEMGTVEASTPTLAVMDDEKWYLLRIDNDMQKEVVREVYPGLTDVTFPEATMKKIEE